MSYTPSEEQATPVQPGHGQAVSHIEPDDIGVGLLCVLFAFVAVVVLLAVFLLQAWFYNWKGDLLAQRNGPIDVRETPAATAEKQLQRIETYGWADRKTQARAIPIGQAMQLVAADMASEAPGKESGGK